MFSDSLFLITARGGSKGIPGKNIRPLNQKPLIYYTIEAARNLVPDDQICISTDSDSIIDVVSRIGLVVPFKRPDHLALDNSSSLEVIMHALNFYKNQNKNFKNIILLQPTSPFRTSDDILNAFSLFSYDLDMVVSVIKCTKDPYYNLFEENKAGFLVKKHSRVYSRRQDVPSLFEYNGAIYIFNVNSLEENNPDLFKKIKKYEMNQFHSIDIDTPEDWLWAEFLLQKKNKF